MRNLVLFVATGAGSGFAPFAPGTAGAALGVILYAGLAWGLDAGAAVLAALTLAVVAMDPTVLLNQTPNHTVALVPTIEVINGPTANRDGVFLVDWWAFGCSRFSRLSR